VWNAKEGRDDGRKRESRAASCGWLAAPACTSTTTWRSSRRGLRERPWPCADSLRRRPPAVVLVRLIVGAVFLSEGIQKFLFPAELGVGRFAKIGLPSPEFLAPFVGTFEITCGLLVLLGSSRGSRPCP